MTLSRRTLMKLGLGAGAASLLPRPALAAESGTSAPPVAREDRIAARPLPLSAVRITGGPLRHAQELDAAYLLELEPDRMLAYYRELAGLPRKGEPYGGWDGPGRNLTGHVAGHYLSAVSLMHAATGDARFRERADYLVDELELVQRRHGDGFCGALQGVRDAFARLSRGEIESAAFDLNGEWSPWYTLHKTFAGLRDAWRFVGNRKALDVETRFAAWAEGVVAPLDAAQIQRMLNTEFGGMNEVMVDLWQDTDDERWLRLADRFEHTEFLEPLRRHQDDLGGKHGNTQIPKIIGSADRYALTGDPGDLLAAAFFFDQVARCHSFSTGGHGTDEYFGPPCRLADRIDGRTAETCNVYNMIKLARRLFQFTPDPAYADFHERALFNHILGSIDPDDGSTCYMVPVGRGVTREYQDMQRSFTCCVGTGMESHALHGDGLYYEAGDRLWVNLYAPSTAEWRSAAVGLTMETGFPMGESARLTFTAAEPRDFALALRRPHWADGFAVRVNGTPVELRQAQAGGDPVWSRGSHLYAWDFRASEYVEIERTWRTGDVVEIDLPKSLRVEGLPDDASRASVMWGPLVLA
ncbi:MAG: glycoside hydrolase family 127 protein, partial [Gemmatimonadota bacterium]